MTGVVDTRVVTPGIGMGILGPLEMDVHSVGWKKPGRRPALHLLLVTMTLPALLAAMPTAAQPAQRWVNAAGGSNLIRPAFWDGLQGASAANASVSITASDDTTPLVDRYGPRLDVSGDFRVVASLQADNDDLAALALVDGVPDDEWGPAMRRLELGMAHGQVVVGVFDGSGPNPADWQTFAADPPLGPITLGLTRIGDTIAVEVSGAEVTSFSDPGVFATGRVLFGARVAQGNQLTLNALDVQAPAQRPAAVGISRCAPDRLLVAGEDDTDVHTGIWWVWPDDGLVRQVEASQNQRSFLVSVSPDSRWVTYYQRSSQAPPDRFVVDMWVMDLATDERYKLVDGSAPLGWMADSKSVVLGDRPYLMALVPSGELVPTEGTPAISDSLRAMPSPNRQLIASVATSSRGAEGVAIVDAGSSNVIMNIPTGRGAIQLAWSPDSSRLAFTSGDDSPDGLIWRLRMVNIADHGVALLDSTRDMTLHSVVWAPALSGCQ